MQEHYLTGKLPDEIRQLTKLETRVLGRYDNTNRIVITEAIGELTALTTLYIAGNGLTSLSDEIGLLSNLKSLRMQNNNLTGTIPVWIGGSLNLNGLCIFGNKLTGEIPADIKNNVWWEYYWKSWIEEQQEGYGFTNPD